MTQQVGLLLEFLYWGSDPRVRRVRRPRHLNNCYLISIDLK